MKVRCYSMLDAKARNFGAPLVFQNDDVARRSAQALIREGNSDQAKFPGDFSLWFIGDFSTETAVFEPAQPVLVFTLSDLEA